jgi:hypothetical protein
VLRVTAERLNSLLDLSSKSLVETQRLKPHLATMQRLKRMQNNGLRALENLNAPQDARSLEAQEALEDARRLLAKPAIAGGKTPSWMSSAGRPASARRCTTPRWPAACVRLPMC